jgi:alpha-1,3-glucan synthase
VAAEFVQKLQTLNADNSKGDLCIEKFLMKSEEAFFHDVKKEKLSSAASIISSKRDSVWGTPAPSVYDYSRPNSPAFPAPGSPGFGEHHTGPMPEVINMTRLQIILSREIGGWPLYTLIIAFSQMLSATSFQITLLGGSNSETNLQLYVLGAVFLAASSVWYALFRYKPSVYILSFPWIFFAIAFFLVGLPSVSSALTPARDALSSAATWSYAVASAAAFGFFGLNFGEEAGAATEVWMMRACLVQGSQQLWIAALWYWGHQLNTVSAASAAPWWIICVVWPLAAMSAGFFFCLLYGLPDYYRQTPPKVPGFLKTLFRRKLVLWFLASELLRDYWLSGPYGRNWGFLWSTSIPHWQTLLLIITFFVVVWLLIIGILTYFSKTHTWLLAVFAVGLGAPRWCQVSSNLLLII